MRFARETKADSAGGGESNAPGAVAVDRFAAVAVGAGRTAQPTYKVKSRTWLETRRAMQLELDMLRREWSIGLPTRPPAELADFRRAVRVRAEWLAVAGPPLTAADAAALAVFDDVVQQAERLHVRNLNRRGSRAIIASLQAAWEAPRESERSHARRAA